MFIFTLETNILMFKCKKEGYFQAPDSFAVQACKMIQCACRQSASSFRLCL